MSDGPRKEEVDALGQPLYPPSDPSGNIDLNMLELTLRMTPAERIAHHNAALELVLALECAGAKYYATQPRDSQKAE